MRPINLAIHQAAVPLHQHVLIWDGAGVAMTGSGAAWSSGSFGEPVSIQKFLR